MGKNLKAQAAMEYLMTYGWAILIVVIVAAALFALGVFNPATYTGTRATGFANLGVPSDWQRTAAGAFTIVLKNALGQAVTFNQVNATCGPVATPIVVLATTQPLLVGAGGTITYTGSCSSIAAGSSYSTTVSASYTVQGQTLMRSDTGTVTGAAA